MSEASIYEYKKLKDYLKEHPQDTQKVKKIYQEIAATYKKGAVERISTIFDHTFAKLYDDISLHSVENVNIKQLSIDNHLILVPNHQSYADFLGISYAFHKKLDLSVYIAAGINLNVFPIGKIFRRGGAFFIRRAFKNDLLYKNVLEAYIYTLLKEQKIIKFYFEGGRSRTGKLLPPRYGLFQMLLESYSHIKTEKPLCFLPISISHESLPEAKSHRAEVFGGEKVKESSTQLFKIFKVFTKRFGSIHLKAGEPIYIKDLKEDRKKQVQDLAFRCFRAVGKGMMVTPTSLLSMVLLDNISGALTMDAVLEKCESILNYCHDFSISISPNLKEEVWRESVIHSLDLMIDGKKIEKVKIANLDRTFYHVRDEARVELLYLKNTILHHFLIPLFIGSAWVNIFRGSIDSIRSLRIFFLEQRKLLKHEFYLPETEDMFVMIRKIIAKILNKEDFSFEDSLSLDRSGFFKLGAVLGGYSSSFSYIYEGYYIAALALKSLLQESFTEKEYLERCKEIYLVESQYGKLIRFPEAFSVGLIKSSMDYFIGERILSTINKDSEFVVAKDKELKLMEEIERFAVVISDFTTLNIKKF